MNVRAAGNNPDGVIVLITSFHGGLDGLVMQVLNLALWGPRRVLTITILQPVFDAGVYVLTR